MNYKRVVNKECEYYPCHNVKQLNCLFCFCPLYTFRECPGTYSYTEQDIKDCSNCNWIHTDDAYDVVIKLIKKEFDKCL